MDLERSEPIGRIFEFGGGVFRTCTRSSWLVVGSDSTRSVSSTMTTVSAEGGTGAPVVMRMRVPFVTSTCSRKLGADADAELLPTTRYVPGPSELIMA